MSERDLRVCFVGDSFVAGIGDSSALGWVGRVTIAAFARGLPLTAYNLGVRRDTSVLISERIADEVRPRLAPAGDPRVILSFGVNDTVVEGSGPRTTTVDTLVAFERIRNTIDADLLLVGPTAVDDDRQNERIELLSSTLRATSVDAGIPFVDTFSATVADEVWRREVREGDSFHPDAAGYSVLAGVVTDPILDWLA